MNRWLIQLSKLLYEQLSYGILVQYHGSLEIQKTSSILQFLMLMKKKFNFLYKILFKLIQHELKIKINLKKISKNCMDQIFCYVCLQTKQMSELQEYKGPNMVDSYIKICEDCMEEQLSNIKAWDNQKVSQRPQDFKNKKIEEEEQKQSTGNVFILLQQQALKYQINQDTWRLIELKFDDTVSLNLDQICQFSLLSSSSGCAQLYGIKKRDLIITGGVLYQQLTFYASVNPTADAITISSGPNLNVKRHSHAVAVSGGGEIDSVEAYLVGGIDQSNQENKQVGKGVKLTHSIEVLDLKQNKQWKIINDLNLKYGRISPSALVLGDYLYVIGGFSQKHLNSQNFPKYSDKLSLSQYVERFNISNKSEHTIIDISYPSPQNFPAASFNIIPFYNQNEVLIVGGTTGKRVLNSIFRLKFEQDKIYASDELQMLNFHAGAAVSRVGNVGMYIFGGAQSYGSSEYINFEQKQAENIFSFQSCLQKALITGQMQNSDLCWSCYFYK